MNAAQIQAAIDGSSQYTIPAGLHTFEKTVFLRDNRKLYAHEDAVVVIPPGSNYAAFMAMDSINIQADLPRTEHGGGPSGNATGLAVYRCKKITLSGGPIIGGWSSCYFFRCFGLTLRAFETRGCLAGYGAQFDHCETISLIDFKAIGHKSDGTRFLAHNKNISIVGGEWRNNGSRFAGGGIIGVGLHLGQSENVTIKGRPIIANNLGNGLDWKATYSPAEYGTMKNLSIDGLVLDGNGANQLEVRWNQETPGTVRPTGFSARDVVIRNGKANGMYLDCDDKHVTNCYFQDCERWGFMQDPATKLIQRLDYAAAVGVVARNDADRAWKPIDSDYERCPQTVVYYNVSP